MKQDKLIKIKTSKGQRLIGLGQPVFIIAEMSGNHNQSIENAKKIIEAAVDAGADAIKLQTYTADTLTIDCDNEYFKIKSGPWAGQSLYQLYLKASTPWEWQAELKTYAESMGLIFFSTPFDVTAVDFLEKMNVEFYKVASFEVVDIPLLEKIGKTKKPVIISRGMASIQEIELALKTLKDSGCPEIAILHCISSYPAESEQMNLATISDIAKRFNVVAGLSDHTLDNLIPTTAVALGASIIEKHLILSRKDGGADANFSLEPAEFKKMVFVCRKVEKVIGKPTYSLGAKESENIIFRKSLFIVKNIKKGSKLNAENVRSIRPGYGLSPKFMKEIYGKEVIVNIKKGTPLEKRLIKNF
jgi:pseudaminic acid synthase